MPSPASSSLTIAEPTADSSHAVTPTPLQAPVAQVAVQPNMANSGFSELGGDLDMLGDLENADDFEQAILEEHAIKEFKDVLTIYLQACEDPVCLPVMSSNGSAPISALYVLKSPAVIFLL